jgi:hypothetical protein
VEFAPLNFDFHPKTVRTWLEQADFGVQRQLTVSHYRVGLLKRLVPLRLLVGMDAVAQWTGDWWQLSPSVFLRALANHHGSMAAPGAYFACPECGQSALDETPVYVSCRACQSKWRITDGIYDFRQPVQAG